MSSFLDRYKEKPEVLPSLCGGLNVSSPLAIGVAGDIGLELEVEAQNLPNTGALAAIIAPETRAFWVAKGDGSLRGEAAEYVLSHPANITEAEYLLQGLWEVFARTGTRFNLSNRCSTHVHCNASGKKVNEITSIIALWTTLEELMVNWCGKQRKTNHFAITSKDSSAIISTWLRFLRDGRWDMNDGFKYTALNLLPLRRFGSVEFRAGNAYDRYQPILDWTKFVHSLTRVASTRFANPQDITAALSELGGRELFSSIAREGGCSTQFIEEVFAARGNEDFDTLALDGFRLAQPLVMGVPWYNYMEQLSQASVRNPFKRDTRGGLPFFTGGGTQTATRGERPTGLRLDWDNFTGARRATTVDPLPDVPPAAPPAAPHGGVFNPNDTAGIPRTQVNTVPNRIDPDRPIQFVCGTPAIVISNTREGLRARALSPLTSIDGRFRLDRTQGWFYDIESGYYSGTRNVAQLMNVVPEPAVIPEAFDEDF